MDDALREALGAFYAAQAGDAPPGELGAETSWRKPVISEALAVHPDQARAAEDLATRRGVPTHFLPDGRPVLTSRRHRRAYLKAHGFHDRDGGYGDG